MKSQLFQKKRSIPMLICMAVLLFVKTAAAESLIWTFTADEQQVKNGPESDGSTNSPGVGGGTIRYDSETNILSYSLFWDGLVGELTKLHVHGPADENSSNPRHIIEFLGPPEVPAELRTTSGSLVGSFELTTLVQPGFDPVPPEEIISVMRSGQAYLNVHTSVFGTGEIRGNLGIPVPEPLSFSTLGLACAALACRPWCRTRS